ncbi:diguanylate cyclase domain-containing protein [Bacillus sp. FJAT-45037]|uniref:diguanylate cyclase domain-containing protein n=1 Tax=Bacillus sp. FJAT-45037 TaxID=2011007 RepID=UPI000C241258|nr:diguanylate cyclase [Bacillus sp. FJAT-45037]
MKRLRDYVYAFFITVVLLTSLVIYNSFTSIETQSSNIIESLNPMETNLNRVLRNLLDQETGMRGYLNTDDSVFLESYYRSMKSFDHNIFNLLVLSESYPEIHLRVKEEFIPSATKTSESLNLQIERMAADPNLDVKVALKTTKADMDSFRVEHSLLSEMIGDEISKSIQQQQTSTWTGKVLVLISSVLSIITAVLLVLSYVRVNRLAHFKELAVSDGLTGIANRRSLDKYLQKQWTKHTLTKKRLGIIFVDIDYFKKYNDHYGHIFGDQVLIDVAAELEAVSKKYQAFCGRYGGEEFMIILKKATEKSIQELTEELVTAVETKNIEHAPSHYKKVTISVGGLLVKPTNKANVKCSVDGADKLLYQSKEDGRNRATVET